MSDSAPSRGNEVARIAQNRSDHDDESHGQQQVNCTWRPRRGWCGAVGRDRHFDAGGSEARGEAAPSPIDGSMTLAPARADGEDHGAACFTSPSRSFSGLDRLADVADAHRRAVAVATISAS